MLRDAVHPPSQKPQDNTRDGQPNLTSDTKMPATVLYSDRPTDTIMDGLIAANCGETTTPLHTRVLMIHRCISRLPYFPRFSMLCPFVFAGEV